MGRTGYVLSLVLFCVFYRCTNKFLGWHVVLDVPKACGNFLLPRAVGAPIVERNLSEIHSAPGRQAASLTRTTHLRSLAAPLSAISTVTSLAETNPAVAMSAHSE